MRLQFAEKPAWMDENRQLMHRNAVLRLDAYIRDFTFPLLQNAELLQLDQELTLFCLGIRSHL